MLLQVADWYVWVYTVFVQEGGDPQDIYQHCTGTYWQPCSFFWPEHDYAYTPGNFNALEKID